MASPGRQLEVDALLRQAVSWARARGDVVALALVGSWARNEAREDSDVDLVLLTDVPAAYTGRDDWIHELAPGATSARVGVWGVIRERRLRLASGLELEVGIGRPSWAETDPLDAGTRDVVLSGFRPLYDPRGLLRNLEIGALETK